MLLAEKKIVLKCCIVAGLWLVSLLLPILVAARASAQPSFPQTGAWVDKTRILYDGAYYIDGDIYDPDDNYGPGAVTNAGNEECRSWIDIPDFNNNTANLLRSIPNEAGFCTNYNLTINLTNTGEKYVNAYRVSGTVLFLPQGLICNSDQKIERIPAYYQLIGNNSPLLQDNPDLAGKYLRIDDNGLASTSDWVEVSGGGGVVRVGGAGCGDQQNLTFSQGGIEVRRPSYAPSPPSGLNIGGTTDENTTTNTDQGPTCEANFSISMSWLVCALLGFIDDGLRSLEDQVSELLTLQNSDYNNPELRQAWSYFRNIASALLVVIGLVMVIGQAVGRD